ncbi:jg21122 [Pararge aegeria aegeria]|uniref:Jg21122 protein n=1 Tax=Pararge aegeria aegeria TaxID=348720 RepID=A0A8S4RPS2_9NEOP|nr:jg21122 [Pararge aegeria aegeria]
MPVTGRDVRQHVCAQPYRLDREEVGAAAENIKNMPKFQPNLIVRFAVETNGCWGGRTKSFIRKIGRRLRETGV